MKHSMPESRPSVTTHTWSNETPEAGLQASVDSGARVFWAYAFHLLPNYSMEEQIGKFRDLANAATYDSMPTTLGIAYDAFHEADKESIQPIAQLLEYVRAP